MDLHSGVPYWQRERHIALDFPELKESLVADVAIIGGGITGALLAESLTREGLDVVLLDKRTPGLGSTLASTGLLQYAVDTPLNKLMGQVGEDRAVHAYRRGLTAVDELEALAESIEVDCAFARRPSLYLASHWWHLSALRREYECRKQFGLPVEFLPKRTLRDRERLNWPGAIRSLGDAQIDPYRFTQGLLRTATSRGLRAFTGAEVAEIQENGSSATLNVGRLTVRCQHIVVATGYEAQRFLPKRLANLQSTYVAVSQPLKDPEAWVDGALVWETARPYCYARQVGEQRAMIGGGDTAFHDDHERTGLVERKVGKLIERFHQLWPTLEFNLAYSWGGTFAETRDGLAYIGKLPTRARTYAALGYGGNGITYSAIAARLITDLILGRPNPDEKVFAFDR